MDPFSLTEGIIAFAQIADRVVKVCKTYIGAVQDAPLDLRFILIEVSTVKTLLDTVLILAPCTMRSSALSHLTSPDGPIEGCHKALSEIEKLLPSGHAVTPSSIKAQKMETEDFIDIPRSDPEGNTSKTQEVTMHIKAELTVTNRMKQLYF
ncbi:hypothetical protein EDB81DRAFT_760469 [Dactylonectria macrodidyma]|uniref:Uncharacterized protein n=1 Tax=Dactylonectria macrodidyma TaxID=307937 RepID=A0A9P9J573_9HYPO|nr:hypothetical protein EDB81DRAFT_760469 [Dactylonectria macrodidyma]